MRLSAFSKELKKEMINYYIACPRCGHTNSLSAYQCVECGIKLANQTLEATSVEETMQLQSRTAPFMAEVDLNLNLYPGEVAIYLVEARFLLRFKYVQPIMIGRDDQPYSSNVQYIDLATYCAFERGMSRHHALIQRAKGIYYITDLDSSNGTTVNGKLIGNNHSHPLENDSLILLGKFGFVFQYG